MKITGECKIEFEKWLGNFVNDGKIENAGSVINAFYPYNFDQLPDSMQYGVLVDYFDSVGVYFDAFPVFDYDKRNYTKVSYWIYNFIVLGDLNEDVSDEEFKTRPEARTKAIEKANEIRNEQLAK